MGPEAEAGCVPSITVAAQYHSGHPSSGDCLVTIPPTGFFSPAFRVTTQIMLLKIHVETATYLAYNT